MNKFRWPEDPKKNPRHEEMQLIGVLDRCAQILREDRIFIRNKIKENDPEVLSFFRPLKGINMQNLQINLRKYLNNVKASMKMQQLMKFKQNHHQTSCTCEKNSKGCTQKQNQSRDYKEHSRDAFKEINGQCAFAQSCFSKQSKPATASSVGRFARSSSSVQLKPPSIVQPKKLGGKTNQFQKCASTKQLPRQASKEAQIGSNHKKRTNSSSMRHQRSYSSAVCESRQPEWTLHDVNKIKSPKFESFANQFKSHQQFESKVSQSLSNQPESTSYTVETTHLKYIAMRDSQELISQSKIPEVNPKKNCYRGDSYDNLFTSPELLMQCRKYIEKVKSPLPKLQVPTINRPSLSSSLVPPSTSSIYSPHFQQIIPQTHITTMESAMQPPLPKLSEHYKQTNTQQATIESAFETIHTNAQSKIESHRTLLQLNKPLPDLGDYYAEDIIDILFYNREGHNITATDFAYVIYSNFADTYPLQKLFEITDADKDGRVSVSELGDWLNRLAMPKHNATRTLFDLIDMDKVGRVTYEQYQRFLNQICESQRESFEMVRSSAERVFKNADPYNTGVISYWTLYLSRKNTWQFQEFSKYLEQFEFSVEP